MRILVVTSTFPRWVSDTEPAFVYDLSKYLHLKGIDIDVLAPHAHGAKKAENIEGISVYRYQYFFSSLQTLAYSGGIMAKLKSNPMNYFLIPFFIFFQTIALYKRLISTDYEIIHVHWIIPQGFVTVIVKMLLGSKSPKIICTSHGGDLYALNNFIFRTIKKWIINKCDAFSVVSMSMKLDVIALGIPEKKIHVMPMGVDLENIFKPIKKVRRISDRLIFVGRLVEKKGVTCLLDAMLEVVKVFPNAELIIVGDGPLRDELEEKVRQLLLVENVIFYGSVQQSQLPKLYSSASIAIIPSIIASSGDQEGLGMVTIEAMGCKCAVIASSLEAIKDVIDENSGILVTPGDSKELAEKIIYLLDNSEQIYDLASKGREKVLEKFNWNKTGKNYFDLFEEYNTRGSLIS